MLKLRIMILVCLAASGWNMFRAASQAVKDPAGSPAVSKSEQIIASDTEPFPEQISSVNEEKSAQMFQIRPDARPVPAPAGADPEVDAPPFPKGKPASPEDCELSGDHLAIIASLGWHGMDFSDDCRVLQWIAAGEGDARRDLVRRRIAGEPLTRANEFGGQEAGGDLADEAETAPSETLPRN